MPSILTGFRLAPDWVCEVVSPGTGRLDRTKKLGVYARAEVRRAWLVDPLARTLEVYRVAGHEVAQRRREAELLRQMLDGGIDVSSGSLGRIDIGRGVVERDGLAVVPETARIDVADVFR